MPGVSGRPGCNPGGRSFSAVPAGTCRATFLLLRSIALIVPKGGGEHGMPWGEFLLPFTMP